MKKIITVICLVSLSLYSCKKEAIEAIEVTYEYKYEVSGTRNSYSVTIQNKSDDTQQWSNVNSGWKYTWNETLIVNTEGIPLEDERRWLYLSAQNNTSSGNVTVKIYRNGIIVASNTSYGSYVIATVSGEY